MRIRSLLALMGVLFLASPFVPLSQADNYGIEEDPGGHHFSKPKSSFQASSDVSYYASTKNAQKIEHVNVSVDDTREDNNVDLQEYTEFNTTTTVTVLNNMGGSGSVYASENLESKTGDEVEVEGVVEIPYGDSALFTTTGTKIISKYPKSEETTSDSTEDSVEKKDKEKAPRVLVS